MHVMNRFLARACAAAAAGVALSTVAVTGASASGGGGVPARPGAFGPAGMVAGPGGPAIPRVGAASVTNSRLFAGYGTAVTGGSATTVTATFTVPTLSCIPSDLGIFPAVFTVNSNSVTAAGVAVKCESDKAVYFPAVQINSLKTSFRTSPFAAGDVINLSASVTTSGTTVQVTDVTKNVTKKLTGAGASAGHAFIGDLAWLSNKGALLGVPNFGKLKYFNCLIDGTALQSWNPQQYQRVNRKGIVQIATGPFSPAPAAFATYFKHS
jgi:peptidase A4-like protein